MTLFGVVWEATDSGFSENELSLFIGDLLEVLALR
jgi:hypothetical protein